MKASDVTLGSPNKAAPYQFNNAVLYKDKLRTENTRRF